MKVFAILFCLFTINAEAKQTKQTMKAIWMAPKNSVQKFIMAGRTVVCQRNDIGSVKCVVNR